MQVAGGGCGWKGSENGRIEVSGFRVARRLYTGDIRERGASRPGDGWCVPVRAGAHLCRVVRVCTYGVCVRARVVCACGVYVCALCMRACARRSPTPKQVKMNPRSASMPSTALSIDPSLPRSALPEPHTETKVVEAVHIRFAQIETVTNRCKSA